MNLTEKVAHLKGLIEGMELSPTDKQSKLIMAIADILEDMALTVSDMDDEVETLGDYIEEIDEDLGDVEKIVFDDDDDECDCCGDDDFCEVTCPKCGEKIYIDESYDPEDIICPACNEHFSCTCDCGCDDCDCCGDDKKD